MKGRKDTGLNIALLIFIIQIAFVAFMTLYVRNCTPPKRPTKANTACYSGTVGLFIRGTAL